MYRMHSCQANTGLDVSRNRCGRHRICCCHTSRGCIRLWPMTALPPLLDSPTRLLCGPGPSNVSLEVLAAMQRPMLGHLDPDMHQIMAEVVEMLRGVYHADAGLVIPLSATGSSGMEAGLDNLLEPGDTAIIGVNGFFGARIVDIARRHGAEVVEITEPFGNHVPNDRLLDALDRHPDAKLVALVHAETSTGVEHPLRELGSMLRDRDVMLMADCVTSLGGVELDFDGWGIDYAYSCTQKCVAAPPGMSPIAVSDRALQRIRARTAPVPFSLDLLALEKFWVQRPPVYHHTAPILHIYALHAALRAIAVEGVDAARADQHAHAEVA